MPISRQRQGAFPLRRSRKSPRWYPENGAWPVLSLAGLRGPGRARGRGREAAAGSKATARTTWAGDSIASTAAARGGRTGLVARRARIARRTPASAAMVIKTDELPAAAPADSAQEPSSQAGGKGRPGAAGEWGRGQGGSRAGGWTGPSARVGLGWREDRCLFSAPDRVASRRALHRAPRPEGHLHCRPRLRPGLDTRGIPGRAAAANTRVPDRGDTCAHTRFRGAPAPQIGGLGGPTPYAPGLGNSPDWGHLTLAPSSSPFPSGSLAFLCTRLQPCEFGSAWDF